VLTVVGIDTVYVEISVVEREYSQISKQQKASLTVEAVPDRVFTGMVTGSSEGRSVVRASFTWGTSLDEAVNDIRDRLDRVIGRLPEDADRPLIRKFDLSAFPIMVLGISSNMEPAALRQLIEDQVQYRYRWRRRVWRCFKKPYCKPETYACRKR
jgi:HAE1 family hydrophobic/amphiphilic exporter-1